MTIVDTIPAPVAGAIDRLEHQLRGELADQREEQGRRNDFVAQRLADIAEDLAIIRGGIGVGKWFLGGIGALVLAIGAGVLHLVLR